MKQRDSQYSFAVILHRLKQQDPEEKLRLAFRLREFVMEIRKTGESYAEAAKRSRAGRTA